MAAMRRVVAAVGENGKSRVALMEPVPVDGELERLRLTNLWISPFELADNSADFSGGFVPFAMSQTNSNTYAMTLVEFAPGCGRDNPGMHSTQTLDHFYVLEGEIVMVLEVGETVLRTGDTGIIRGAMHGWRNDGARVAKLVFFVVPAAPLETIRLARLPEQHAAHESPPP